MSDTKNTYDSVLMGFADEPKFNDGQLSSWKLRLRDHELREIMDRYMSKGKDGVGSVSITLFMSKSGKPFLRVYNPNSESAREYREKNAQAAQPVKAKEATSQPSNDDDLPF